MDLFSFEKETSDQRVIVFFSCIGLETEETFYVWLAINKRYHWDVSKFLLFVQNSFLIGTESTWKGTSSYDSTLVGEI